MFSNDFTIKIGDGILPLPDTVVILYLRISLALSISDFASRDHQNLPPNTYGHSLCEAPTVAYTSSVSV